MKLKIGYTRFIQKVLEHMSEYIQEKLHQIITGKQIIVGSSSSKSHITQNV
jgi:predicted secreted protein